MASVPVQSNFINNAQCDNYPISPNTTAKQLVYSILQQHGMSARDPNLFYLTVDGSDTKNKDLMDDTHPYVLLKANPDLRLIMQMRPGGLIKVYDSCLIPESYYKSFFIAKKTTSREVIQLLLASYGHQEDPLHFHLVERSLKGEEIRTLRPDDCPLLCVKNVKNVQLHLKRVDTLHEDPESALSRDDTIQRLRESFHWLHKMRATNNAHLQRVNQSMLQRNSVYETPLSNTNGNTDSTDLSSISSQSFFHKPPTEKFKIPKLDFYDENGERESGSPQNDSIIPDTNGIEEDENLKYRSKSFHNFNSSFPITMNANSSESSQWKKDRKENVSLSDLKLPLEEIDDEDSHLEHGSEEDDAFSKNTTPRNGRNELPQKHQFNLRRHKSMFAPKSARSLRDYSEQKNVINQGLLSARGESCFVAHSKSSDNPSPLYDRMNNGKHRRVLPTLPPCMDDGVDSGIHESSKTPTATSQQKSEFLPLNLLDKPSVSVRSTFTPQNHRSDPQASKFHSTYTLSEDTQRILRSLSQRHIKPHSVNLEERMNRASYSSVRGEYSRKNSHCESLTGVGSREKLLVTPSQPHKITQIITSESAWQLPPPSMFQSSSSTVHTPSNLVVTDSSLTPTASSNMATMQLSPHSHLPVHPSTQNVARSPNLTNSTFNSSFIPLARFTLFDLLVSHRILSCTLPPSPSNSSSFRCYVSEIQLIHPIPSSDSIRSGPEGRKPNLLLSPRCFSHANHNSAFQLLSHRGSKSESAFQSANPVLRLELFTALSLNSHTSIPTTGSQCCDIRSNDILLEIEGIDTFRRELFQTYESVQSLENQVNTILNTALGHGEAVNLVIAREICPLSREDRNLLHMEESPREWNKNYSLLIEKYIQLKLHVAKSEGLLRDMQRSLSHRIHVQEVVPYNGRNNNSNSKYNANHILTAVPLSARTQVNHMTSREFRDKAKELSKGFFPLELTSNDVK